jgi:hypothetical protein
MSDLGIGDFGQQAGVGPQPELQRQQPVSPKEIRRRWDKAQRATQTQREQAAINEQFILNKHWLRWNRGIGRLEEMPRNPDRVRVTVNRVGPDSHRLLAKLTSRDLAWEVPPNSPDDQAIQASRVAEQALYDTARRQGWEDIRYDHALATWQGGVAGIMVEWDRKVGTPIAMDETGQMVHTGDVCLTVLPFHEIGVEPGTRNAEKALWWIHARALPPSEVQETYNLADTPKADARAVDSVWRVHNPTDHAHTPLVMVFTLYERPTSQSDGRIVTTVGDEVVDESPWYFPFTDRLNLATCVVQPINNKWYGHTPVTDAVPVQTAMNASWSSILEHLKLAGNARLWIPEGSVEDIGDLSDTAGEHAEYVPINGMRPQYESPPPMPEWWVRAPDLLGGAMNDILGQQDVSRGVAPSGVESGIAMSLLQENSDTPIGRFSKNMAGMWGRVGSMCLELFATFVQDTRNAKVMMPNNKIPEVVQWNGSILHGHTTAIVPMDSVTPRNRNAQAAYAFQLHDRGLVTSPVELAKIADLPDQDDLLEGIDPDTARAMRENSHIAAGAARTVDTIDDHMNHIIHHRNFMRSQRFENLPQQIQMNMRLHMAAHEQYAAAQAAGVAMSASVSPMAAALPTETVNPLDPQAMAEAAMMSQMAPSAATAGLGQQMPTDLAAAQLNNGGQQPMAPSGAPSPDAPMGPQAQATQDLLTEQPPQ